ncbi:MAG: 2-dehydropantoate 2-reductase [Natronospirillum sp.]
MSQPPKLKRPDFPLPPNHVDIIGPGALGLHLALSLPDDVTVRLRHPRFNTGTTSLSYADASRTRTVETLALDDPNPIQCALFTTKAFQVVPALRTILTALHASSDLVLLNNGLGPQDDVCDLFPGNVWAGTTTEGALRTDTWQVRHTGYGATLVGPWREEPNTQPLYTPPPIGHILQDSRWKAQWVTSTHIMREHLWRKVIINCAINPLTALHNLRNGDLLAPEWLAHWQSVVVEAVAVANAMHMAFDTDTMIADVQQVMQATAQNYSSMHQDWQHGRPTEADFILGTIIRHGAAMSLPTPRVSDLFKALTSTAKTRGPDPLI